MKDNLLQCELDIRTVVLVGRQDFGRCPLAAHLPTALWPIAGKPAVERLLSHLASAGIGDVVVCCEDDQVERLELIGRTTHLNLTVLAEDLTGGTAGCLRDAVGNDPGDVVLLFSGSMASPPAVMSMVRAHLDSGADLTMVFNPARSEASPHGSPAEIYLCKPEALRHIPRGGYSDIKEGLIPSILRAEGTVRPYVLPRNVGNFHDRGGYLAALSAYLAEHPDLVDDQRPHETDSTAADTPVHPTARIYGPVLIADQARVAADATVIGPAVVGHRASVGRGSTVVRSVLWDGAEVGEQCEVLESIVDRDMRVPDRVVIAERTISARADAAGKHPAGEVMEYGSDGIGQWIEQAMGRWSDRLSCLPYLGGISGRHVAYGLGAIGLLTAFLWCYWPTFVDLRSVWQRSDEYSAGQLVPFLALYVLWSRRRELAQVSIRPALIGGAVAFFLAQYVRNLGLHHMYRSAERLSVILAIAAIILMLVGWRLLVKLIPILVFLCLMMPWPNRVQSAITLPLQRWATTSAVFGLEMAGYDVLQDGNIIKIGETSVAVAEACNGLRMITAFFVISGLVVLLANRAWWEKLLVLVSSLPIALLCNTVRLTITAILFTKLEGENVEQLFHDFGGYAMMPLALAMVIGELWLLAQLTTPPVETAPSVIARRRPRHVPDS